MEQSNENGTGDDGGSGTPLHIPRHHRFHKPITQAERIIKKFGGARRLAKILAAIDPTLSRNPSSVYRWTYPHSKGGTNGIIPTRVMEVIMKAARLEGVSITAEDLDPRKRIA